MASTAGVQAQPAVDLACSVLVLHAPDLDPRGFLNHPSTQAGRGAGGEDISPPVRWDIDNKYYTASIHFQSRRAPGDAEVATAGADDEVPVIIYLFSGQPPDPLPAALTRLITASPRDIALAVRVRPDAEGGRVTGTEDVAFGGTVSADAFDELGMEFIDECDLGSEEDDDDRPMDPLEQIRQTLQTHLWPNMVRKPLTSARGRPEAAGFGGLTGDEGDMEDVIGLVGSESDSSQYSDDSDSDVVGVDEKAGAPLGGTAFPVSFSSASASGDERHSNRRPIRSKDGVWGGSRKGSRSNDDFDGLDDYDAFSDDSNDNDGNANGNGNGRGAFPSLQTLRDQLSAAAAPNLASRGQSSAYAGLMAMNEQLALANREFAQAKREREMAADRRMRRLEALEDDLLAGLGDSSDDDEEQGKGDGEGDGAGAGTDGVDSHHEEGNVISFGGSGSDDPAAQPAKFGSAGPMGSGTGPSEAEWKRLEDWLSLDREQVLRMDKPDLGGLASLNGLIGQGGSSLLSRGAGTTGVGRAVVGGNGAGQNDGLADDDEEDEERLDDWGDAGYAMLEEPGEGDLDDVDAEAAIGQEGGEGAHTERSAGTEDDFGEFVSSHQPTGHERPASAVDAEEASRPSAATTTAAAVLATDVDEDTAEAAAKADQAGTEAQRPALGFEDDFTSPATSASPVAHHSRRRDESRDKPSRARSNKNKSTDRGATNPASNFPPLPLDPTPLLLHLQSIRAELAGLEDEDERRVRAAREVGGLMRGLGVEGWDEDEDGLDQDFDLDLEPESDLGMAHGREAAAGLGSGGDERSKGARR